MKSCNDMKQELYGLLRGNIRKLVPYSTARDDCKARMDIYLDANENPYENGVNRYPSPHQTELKERLSVLKKVPAENIFLGNGSDEAIDLVFRLFCPPGKSSMIQAVPTYGMYGVAAAVNDVDVIDVPLTEDFALDADAVLNAVRSDTAIIFLCSPNNPSGNLLDKDEIRKILDNFSGITVVDEAYMDFAGTESLVSWLEEYPRLVVFQTLSKAWGMAGLRIGIAMADAFIIDMMSRVKYPYNISVLNQRKALEVLDSALEKEDRAAEIVEQRKYLSGILQTLPSVVKVYPSDSNFLLVKFKDKDAVFSKLISEGIIVRDRSSAFGCADCLRITVGTPEENVSLLKALGAEPGAGAASRQDNAVPDGVRKAAVTRRTGETFVSLRLCLDEFRKPSVSTGLNFFNHMLEQIGYHGGIALDIVCFGDLGTDDHHTVEDVAIALGDAVREALGDKAGIGRYGFALPMDEAEAAVLMDLGGRIDFSWDVTFRGEKIGDVNSAMFEHFFKSLCEHLRCNLHIRARGTNDHHVIEGVFKAFARALKAAVHRERLADTIPSSKGWI